MTKKRIEKFIFILQASKQVLSEVDDFTNIYTVEFAYMDTSRGIRKGVHIGELSI